MVSVDVRMKRHEPSESLFRDVSLPKVGSIYTKESLGAITIPGAIEPKYVASLLSEIAKLENDGRFFRRAPEKDIDGNAENLWYFYVEPRSRFSIEVLKDFPHIDRLVVDYTQNVYNMLARSTGRFAEQDRVNSLAINKYYQDGFIDYHQDRHYNLNAIALVHLGYATLSVARNAEGDGAVQEQVGPGAFTEMRAPTEVRMEGDENIEWQPWHKADIRMDRNAQEVRQKVKYSILMRHIDPAKKGEFLAMQGLRINEY